MAKRAKCRTERRYRKDCGRSFDVNSFNAVWLNAQQGCDPCAQRLRRIVTVMYSNQLTAAILVACGAVLCLQL